ncbi:NAD(P)/FAD-dependent oxidoreductase [Mucilaginibacter sp. SG564]|uniref:NAD(P)/FAD-dependent oxidoreductase n=1 Tax=Mucilaginibacter sp. SG564 TaxID=2587022 RepID=UPI00155831E6|nr:NAD(P)/FAD-dependent oxidoreductase [Mucilaginibacter sp. SG564]NOW96050.1 NADH dehydrogenase [Mucilaginibacter sp. SG564]
MKLLSSKRVIIVGGGFAGVNFAQNIAGNDNFQITLIDANNYNYFPPLLYQVATGFLAPSDISYPFRKLFRHRNIQFRMGKLLRIDPDNKICYLDNGELAYDFLVLAHGAKSNFFGNALVEKNALPMKTVDDALSMRNVLFTNLEKATVTTDLEERKKLLTIVVAGGGPTGVEVAGMLAEMRKYIYKKDYPELPPSEATIMLVDGSPNVLNPMSEKSHKNAKTILENLGVTVILNTTVTGYDGEAVILSNGSIIPSKTLIWASGVTANTLPGIPQSSLGRQNRILVNEFNQVLGLSDIYAIGDIALLTSDKAYPNGHPQLAQPAIQQGNNLARNLKKLANLKPMKPFVYFDRGDMAVIGRNKAVIDLFKNKVHFTGIIAIFSWLFIHLISLVNYRNKLKTLYNWIAAYISRDQALRIIFKTKLLD